MYHIRRYLAVLVFGATDYLAVTLALAIALVVRDAVGTGVMHLPRIYLWLWIPLIYIIFIAIGGGYQRSRPSLDLYRDTFKAGVGATIISIVMLYLLKIDLSRAFLLTQAVASSLTIPLARHVASGYLKRNKLLTEPAILVGAGLTAERVLRFFENDRGYNYSIRGIVDDHPISARVTARYHHRGRLKDLTRLVRAGDIKTVIITAPGLEKEKLQHLINEVQPYVRTISFVPDLIGTPMGSVDVDSLFSEEIMLLRLKNNLARRRNRWLKRAFDIVAVVSGGLVILPFIIIIAIIVGIDNRGRIIFAHTRVGRGGRLFPCYKFQTMVPNASEMLEKYLAENPAARAEWEESFKLTHDPRVTRVGAFLRKTSLDELPQLLNVLKGEMSLVGPRPIVEKEIARYGENFKEYKEVLPGITGMWQASGRSDTTYPERVAMDTWYVRNWSIWIDLMYLAKTVKIVLTGKGAY